MQKSVFITLCLVIGLTTLQHVQAFTADGLYRQGMDAQKAVIGQTPELVKSRKLLEQAANAGSVPAMMRLGAMFMGFPESGVHRDDKTAFKWFKKAADAKSAAGMYRLGRCYLLGEGTAVDASKAAALFDAATPLAEAGVEHGDDTAMLALAIACERGNGMAKDLPRAKKLYEQAMGLGNVEAIRRLGQMYQYGRGVDADLNKAADLYRMGVDKGDPACFYDLGITCIRDKNVPGHAGTAMHWFSTAADAGYTDAYFQMGSWYDTGDGINLPVDQTKAFECYTKGANLGNSSCEEGLGYMYEEGHGVKADLTRAQAWYRKSADDGDTLGMNAMGILLEKRNDFAGSVLWYTKSANADSSFGMYLLGTAYERGHGVTKDDRKARSWFQRAADHGNDDAKKWLADHPGPPTGIGQSAAAGSQ